jgi:hypothetical protein
VAIILGFSIAAAVPVAWFFLRSDSEADANSPVTKNNPKQTAKSEQKQVRSNYKGASIQPGEQCCQAVRELSETRFLVEAAPRLPLERCDRITECLCKYHNHPDRRSGEDRRNVCGSMSTAGKIGMRESNHRSGMDRRASTEDEFAGIEFEVDVDNYQ